jgi:hypothetical protein
LETNVGDPTWAWIGTINWPAAALGIVITAGVAYITKKLTEEGYAYTSNNYKSGTKQWTEVKFTNKAFQIPFTPGGVVPQKVLNDWTTAINADPNADGHASGGVVSNPSFLTQQKKKALLQIEGTNGVIDVTD